MRPGRGGVRRHASVGFQGSRKLIALEIAAAQAGALAADPHQVPAGIGESRPGQQQTHDPKTAIEAFCMPSPESCAAKLAPVRLSREPAGPYTPAVTSRHTIARAASVSGTCLHAGTLVHMRLEPAAAGQGVVFVRTDLGGAEIPARYDLVSETRLGTVLEKDGARVGVVEHLMAAVAGAGVDDLKVVLDGPEPPILDGDALSYLTLIQNAGLKDQKTPRQAIEF